MLCSMAAELEKMVVGSCWSSPQLSVSGMAEQLSRYTSPRASTENHGSSDITLKNQLNPVIFKLYEIVHQ